MTLRVLKIFIAVAEELNMHRAAERLYISQPSVSQAIADLEKEYHVKLFERISQRLYLTDTAKELLTYAYRVVRAYEEMENMLLSKGQLKQIRIGTSVSVGTCLLYELLDQMQQQHPEVEVSVVVNNTGYIEQLLLESQIDVGIVEGKIVAHDLQCFDVCEDELILVSSPTHPLAHMICTMDELQGEIFISREKGSFDRNQFEKYLKDHQITIQKRWICSNTEAIKNAVIRGYGIAILSRMVVQTELLQGILSEIHLQDVSIKRNIQFVYHKDKFLTDEIQWFAQACGLDLNTSQKI